MNGQDWYTINDTDRLDTPALVVYPHRVKQNIDMLKYMIDDVFRLRPHVKTFKNIEAAQLLIDAGITKFKCATIAEAEMLALAGAPDVLLAYQPQGPKLQRFIRLIQTYPKTKFSCLVDNLISAQNISAAVENDISINIYIDINVGMNRTGITPDAALQLFVDCNTLPNINLTGLHVYDGHIHDADINIRTERCNAAYEPVNRLQAALQQKGYQTIVIAGGSPTFPIHARRKDVECSPGTFIYWDRGYQLSCPEQPFLPAALIITRVVSLPGKTLLCLDCGHKSVAAENELSKRIYFLNAPELKPVSQSEEHLVVDTGRNHDYQIGDVLYGLPYHICPTVALYERVITIENNTITGEWKNIARDRKINI